MSGLNRDQMVFFKEQGYLPLPNLLDPAAFQPLIHELEEVIDAYARQAYQEGRLEDVFEGEPFDRRLACLWTAMEGPADLWRAVHGKHHKTAGMFAIVTHPALLDVAESLLGPEILAHPQFNLRAKLPHQQATVVPWHQDLGYLHEDAEATFMVNFWIPLVDAPMETGALQVLPGSHRWGLLPHEELDGYLGLPEAALPPHRVVDQGHSVFGKCPLTVRIKGGILSLTMLNYQRVEEGTPAKSAKVKSIIKCCVPGGTRPGRGSSAPPIGRRLAP
jgi:hypothetical protein